ncbi:fibronectin type III domain-containing protein [Paenibacillus sp. HB172176]|uniref:fibronectin type III domain-containing protein n=1 Tax=Paenibacillus sp. HB172176 TaxID=2493690 RepID=UPI00143C9676|nr:fibronectin type III domain-containing protein [Paenibacillus sp. HB172176]
MTVLQEENDMALRMYEFNDHLDHPKYEWPLSPVCYRLSFARGEAPLADLALRGQDGNDVPMQIAVEREEDGWLLEGSLCFLTDLPRGGHRRFELYARGEEAERAGSIAGPQGEARLSDNAIADSKREACVLNLAASSDAGGAMMLTSGPLRLRVLHGISRFEEPLPLSQTPALFELGLEGAERLATANLAAPPSSGLRVRAIESAVVSSGPVYHEQELRCLFEGGASYAIRLRLTAGLPFVELFEEMQGIAKEDGASLDVAWDGLQPERRYALYRGEEAVDAYLAEDGELPFRVLPYDNARSWHRCRTAAFSETERGLEAGLFIGNAERWDDGEYALWRSSDTLAIRFSHRRPKQSLRTGYQEACPATLAWHYPLAAGTRETNIALYESRSLTDRREGEKAFNEHESSKVEAGIDRLALWHSLLALDKVKDWVLDWEEPQEAYPRLFEPGSEDEERTWWYFNRRGNPVPGDMEEIVGKLSFGFNNVYHTSPVTSREFAAWTPIFDLSAPLMSAKQFKRLKAASALMAYVREDEGVAPIRNSLAGHPNFLMDFKAVPAFMASLFPNHPHARRWVEHFERAVALNLKYHTRPAVAAWEAEGGRWTENLGCYVWACIVPMTRAGWCVRRTFGESAPLYPNLRKLGNWLLGTLSAPVGGTRTYPPQGAHSGVHQDPMRPTYVLRVLAGMLANYDPELSEGLFAVCPRNSEGFESKGKGDVWRRMLQDDGMNRDGTAPQLRSTKFTGYGFVLRSEVGSPGEMSVYLQQIDDGPNYRWGRSGDGGNGNLYYYADNRRYSYNRPEDVGDDNMGAGEASSSFSVLVGHEFKSIGRADLTGPLHDFGFAQFAEVRAGESAKPFYRSRSVLMSGNDYIVVYDEVADMRVRGRFSWFTARDESFPNIYQLKPGVAASAVDPAGPVDAAPVKAGEYYGRGSNGYPNGSKGRYYDGFGNFLTVVTHRGTWQPQLTEVKATRFGAVVALCGRTDYLFRDAARIRFDEEGVRFDGHAGIVRKHGEDSFEAALFEGTAIGGGGVTATLSGDAAFAFAKEGGTLTGQSHTRSTATVRLELPAGLVTERHRLYVDGVELPSTLEAGPGGQRSLSFELPAGKADWQWAAGLPVPSVPQGVRSFDVAANESELSWDAVAGADRYRVAVSADNGKSWTELEATAGGERLRLSGYASGTKLLAKVRAANAEGEGEWSHSHPIYVTDREPAHPEGLRLSRADGGIRAEWGGVPGAKLYRLYREWGGEQKLVYEGDSRFFVDEAAAAAAQSQAPAEAALAGDAMQCYRVSAVSGIGESDRSPVRDTRGGGMIDWDSKPEEGFRRYERSHEYGFNGFHYWDNERKGSLPNYPE